MKFKVNLSLALALSTVRGMRRRVESELRPIWNAFRRNSQILNFYGLFNSRKKARAFW